MPEVAEETGFTDKAGEQEGWNNDEEQVGPNGEAGSVTEVDGVHDEVVTEFVKDDELETEKPEAVEGVVEKKGFVDVGELKEPGNREGVKAGELEGAMEEKGFPVIGEFEEPLRRVVAKPDELEGWEHCDKLLGPDTGVGCKTDVEADKCVKRLLKDDELKGRLETQEPSFGGANIL